MPEQTEMFIWNNVSLFSNNYLEHRLPISDLWASEKEKAAEAFERVRRSYGAIQALNLGAGHEAELENKFIQPVLSALGYVYHVQPVTHRGHKKKRPDYALFMDSDAHRAASGEREEPRRFFSQALTILEAKYWGRRLNDADRYDILDSRDPTAQTLKYLEDVHLHTDGKINWSILTNGKHWRLFYYRAASRSGNYFEVDLEEIIKRGNLNDFLYFYLFFSRDAFIPDTITGKTWLDRHVEGSEAYAKAVSTRLKDLIFDEVFEGLARGFVHYRQSELGIKEETEEGRKAIFEGCLTVLYRLLFLLYAESRDLLPVKESGYFNNSLKKLKEDISKDLLTLGIERMSKRSYTYWARLEGLFNIIAKGDPALNVPVYNGGLFETLPDNFVSNHKMPDPFLAEAIELLTVDQKGEEAPGTAQFIDYSSLNVRHLGDIYEGLLEFHVQIADEETVEVKEKGKSFWKKLSEAKEGAKTYRRKAKGDVYIENSKHERKATGSYYTPHYIVEYIAENTVGPVLKEKFKRADEILTELDGLYEKQHRQLKKPGDWKHWEHPGEPKGEQISEILRLENEVFETLFDIKVLDPAMGSGHFLVHAVDFVSDRMVTFLADYPDNPVIRRIEEMKKEILGEVDRQGVRIDGGKLTEVNLIKRTVMKRCIYGVDLNEMAVELAKLSLWLDSFTLGAPLSFLDHHLKWGNSLIGTNLEALEKATAGRLFAINLEPLKRAIRDMLFVSSLSDATYQQVKDSAKKYNEADTSVEGYRILLDMLISEYFWVKEGKVFLQDKGIGIDLNNLKKSIDSMPAKDRKVIDAIEKVAHEKRFFHWEIEFPEVFYERNGGMEQKVEKKKNPGFDCVIGNPPYYTLSLGKGQEQADQKELAFFEAIYPHSSEYKMNTFALFSERALQLTKRKGFWSFILPNTVLTNYYLTNLRKWIITNFHLQQFLDLRYRVFDEAEIGGNALVFAEVPLLDCADLITSFSVINNADEFSLKSKSLTALSQSTFARLPDTKFLTDFKVAELLMHIQDHSQKLGELATFYQGVITGDNKKFLAKAKVTPKHKKILRGEDIDRYGISFNDNYVLYEPSELWSNTEPTMFLVPSKIVSRQTSDHLVAALDTEQFFTLDSTHVIHSKVDHCFLLAVFNCKLLNFVYQQIVPEIGKTFAQVKVINLKQLPIPCISFTTPEEERKKAVESLKDLYSSGKGDRIITEVEGFLPEKSDVIHDILAFLAQQMIEMNKAKNEEIKGFLKWFEREIGSEIENLANKTAVKEYHEHDFVGLLEVLKKNKGKLSIDLSSRKKQELLEEHFKESTSKLAPLKARIIATDDLINEIVFRLYGLTEDEVRIVKGEA